MFDAGKNNLFGPLGHASSNDEEMITQRGAADSKRIVARGVSDGVARITGPDDLDTVSIVAPEAGERYLASPLAYRDGIAAGAAGQLSNLDGAQRIISKTCQPGWR